MMANGPGASACQASGGVDRHWWYRLTSARARVTVTLASGVARPCDGLTRWSIVNHDPQPNKAAR
jgi:hypothetical protein